MFGASAHDPLALMVTNNEAEGVLSGGQRKRLKLALASWGLETSACAAQPDRPSLGHWLGVCRDGLRSLREAKVPVLSSELVDAFFDKRGKPAAAALALDDLVAWRNRRASALTKMDHVVLTRVDPGSMTRITRGAAALAA